ncbi:MAG: DUF1573 domain-containing protein [candidate division Zixibacteria bacterium]|nr:DUF1573 domain-containing protein [candidate division Zixibacteria bacterium]
MSFQAWPIFNQDSLKLFKVEPFRIALDSTKPEEQKKGIEFEVNIKNVSSEPMEFSLVSTPTEFVKVDMPGGQIKPGKEKSIKVKFDKDIASEIFTKSFTIEANDAAKTRITVPVTKNQRWLAPGEQPPATGANIKTK